MPRWRGAARLSAWILLSPLQRALHGGTRRILCEWERVRGRGAVHRGLQLRRKREPAGNMLVRPGKFLWRRDACGSTLRYVSRGVFLRWRYRPPNHLPGGIGPVVSCWYGDVLRSRTVLTSCSDTGLRRGRMPGGILLYRWIRTATAMYCGARLLLPRYTFGCATGSERFLPPADK